MAERFSDRQVRCDFCQKDDCAFMHVAEMKHCQQVISVCRKCRADKKPEKMEHFVKWFEPTNKD